LALESLHPKLPQHVDLLGLKLVVWADSKGTWHCLEDRCPHRLAPLSEGRVEGDTLMCCYHGWTFDAGGACTRIPQLSDAKAAATACASPKACVTAYPCRAQDGLLWIWPEPTAKSAAIAQATPVPGLPSTTQFTPWFVRDLPVRFDTLMENVMDPSHVPFAHHGIQGNRNKVTPNVAMELQSMSAEGFHLNREFSIRGMKRLFNIEFSAPSSVQYYTVKGFPFLNLLVTPTKPGWSRFFASFPTDVPGFPAPIRLIMRLKAAMPWATALDHALERNAVLDGDTYMLHVAERELPVTNGLSDGYIRSCYMPAPDDSPVIAWRRWLGRHGGGALPTCSPADAAAMPPAMAKRDALDRGGQHLVHCKHCQGAVKQVDVASAVAAAVGVVALFTAVAKVVAVAGAPSAVEAASTAAPAALATALQGVLAQPGLVQAAGVALAAAAVWVGLQRFRAKFFYEDYVHAFRD